MLRLLFLLARAGVALIGGKPLRQVWLRMLTQAAGILLVACLALVAAVFATAALYLWLEQQFSAPTAALAMAGLFLLLAGLGSSVLWFAASGRQRRSGAEREAESVGQATERALTAVARQPGRSLALAVATGIAVGIALRRR